MVSLENKDNYSLTLFTYLIEDINVQFSKIFQSYERGLYYDRGKLGRTRENPRPSAKLSFGQFAYLQLCKLQLVIMPSKERIHFFSIHVPEFCYTLTLFLAHELVQFYSVYTVLK